MNYIYHGVPEQMMGTKLYPLNKMPESMATIRDANLAKYTGREEIMERKIPLLSCLWNDVIQFLPLHPQKVFELQRAIGIMPEVPAYNFYEIPLEKLDPAKTVIFFKTAPGDENATVKWLADVDFASIQDVPQATKEYYKSLVGTGELPLNYQFIPHVIYADVLDVYGMRVVTLNNHG
jgi:hypothetical protein